MGPGKNSKGFLIKTEDLQTKDRDHSRPGVRLRRHPWRATGFKTGFYLDKKLREAKLTALVEPRQIHCGTQKGILYAAKTVLDWPDRPPLDPVHDDNILFPAGSQTAARPD